MDDEYKIEKIESISKSIFLQKDDIKHDDQKKIYSLDEEFRKTRKNRNLLYYTFVFEFVAIIILSAFLITKLYNRNKSQSGLDISSVNESLELNKILAEKNKEELLQTENEISKLRNQMKKEIENVKILYSQRRTDITNKTGKSPERLLKIQNLNTEEAEQIKKIQTKYSNSILKLQKDEILFSKGSTENILNNTRKLQELKLNRLKNKVILKYNPIFSEKDLIEILVLKRRISALQLNKPIYENELIDSNIINKSSLDELRRDIKNQSKLLNRLKQIPYTNSIPAALNALERLSQSIITKYEFIWGSLINLKKESDETISEKNSIITQKNKIISKQNSIISKNKKIISERNKLINRYTYALYKPVTKLTNDGIIIDPRNPEGIHILLYKNSRIKPGVRGYIVRNDKLIGTVKLFQDNEGIKAKTIRLKEKNQIKPLDLITINNPERK